TADVYKLLDIPARLNGPEGVAISSKGVRRYDIVHNKSPWAALLIRTGKSDWQTVPDQLLRINDAARQAGRVALSINSAISQDMKAIKPDDQRWWQPNGFFEVT